jgi:hypothetical protein
VFFAALVDPRGLPLLFGPAVCHGLSGAAAGAGGRLVIRMEARMVVAVLKVGWAGTIGQFC